MFCFLVSTEALAASTVKIKGNDVLATWKVMVALAGAPALYSIYAAGATVLAFKYDLSTRYKFYAPFATMAGLPLIGYSALKFGEVGADVYKSLRPLFLSVLPGNVKQLDRIRTMRAALQVDIDSVVNELGPQLFDDFQRTRVIQQPAAVPQPSPTRLGLGKRRSSYGPAGIGTLLTHPMSWLDETLFGWGSSPQATSMSASGGDSEATSESGGTKSGYASAYASGYTTEDPDYDEVSTKFLS
jgi:glycerol-3-phosphate O-acyltransferase/dihydroxyacetone phosphate acyltransferase